MRRRSYYYALSRKDRRLDGKVFFGVKTTGIYCRPICPARTPLEKNVVYFKSAALAESAGFRACLRCRPETVPGTPAWRGTQATISRALKLLSQVAKGESSISPLAGRLGVSERHLRRLFKDQIGASPFSVALNHRLDTARALLEESELAVTEIAYASGFNSLRRFNDAFRKRFQMSPTTLRQKKGQPMPDTRYWKTILNTPVGELTLIATEKGLHSLQWESEQNRQRLRFETARPPKVLSEAKRQLKEYFSGKRRTFDLPLDLQGTHFQLAAWKALQTIPFGETVSYQEQARRLGDYRKARAVGSANHRNPVAIVVPCHRVVGKSGDLTGFAAGLRVKRFLLDLEADA